MRVTPLRSCDHGKAERYQPCRDGVSSARWSSVPTRNPYEGGFGSGEVAQSGVPQSPQNPCDRWLPLSAVVLM